MDIVGLLWIKWVCNGYSGSVMDIVASGSVINIAGLYSVMDIVGL